MSGIFKGDSIYNNGGGGGGGSLKNGGTLPESVSGVITIENNTIYEYTNLANDSLTFVFENQEDVYNAVIEVTTNVNSDIYVGYLDENGLVRPISVIGPTSITANGTYKVTVLGDSYVVENVTVSNDDPIAIRVIDTLYPCKQYGNFVIVGPVSGGEHGIYWGREKLRDYELPKFRAAGFDLPTDSQWNQYKLNPSIGLLGYYDNNDRRIEDYGVNCWIWRNNLGMNDAWIYDGNSWRGTFPASWSQCILLLAKTI
jgi:hypothetical protein